MPLVTFELSQVAAELVALEEDAGACSPIPEEIAQSVSGKIVLISRGGCLFVTKV